MCATLFVSYWFLIGCDAPGKADGALFARHCSTSKRGRLLEFTSERCPFTSAEWPLKLNFIHSGGGDESDILSSSSYTGLQPRHARS
jgi:hypothetical protein